MKNKKKVTILKKSSKAVDSKKSASKPAPAKNKSAPAASHKSLAQKAMDKKIQDKKLDSKKASSKKVEAKKTTSQKNNPQKAAPKKNDEKSSASKKAFFKSKIDDLIKNPSFVEDAEFEETDATLLLDEEDFESEEIESDEELEEGYANEPENEDEALEFKSESEISDEETLPWEGEEIDPESIPVAQEEAGFLPEPPANHDAHFLSTDQMDFFQREELEASELGGFESAEITDIEMVDAEKLESILESILFASDRPVSMASIKEVFKGTNIKTEQIRKALDFLVVEYAGGKRGVILEEIQGGYQLRTKVENMNFIKRTLKARQFKVSGPALEVLSVVAYKQPVVKYEIDEIRGVESGHLLRALMEKGLVQFQGKSELPGKPMQYATTRKFLEIFSLRNLKELPTLSQIDELLPEGIDAEEAAPKPTLSTITDSMSESIANSYSVGEEELNKIVDQLDQISTSSDFFEEEKRRQKEKKDEEKALSLREALMVGEKISTRDMKWLINFDAEKEAARNAPPPPPVAAVVEEEVVAVEASEEDSEGAEEGAEDRESWETADSDESEDSDEDESDDLAYSASDDDDEDDEDDDEEDSEGSSEPEREMEL